MSLILVITVGLALSSDFVTPSPIWVICRLGLCRADQIAKDSSYGDTLRNPALVRQMLYQDSANPYRWADYADAVAGGPAYERALELGPNLPPILVRAFLFYNTRGDRAAAAPLAARVLTLTAAYDEILFAYGIRPPPQQRPANAWLTWLLPRASDADLLAAWRWISAHHLADDPTTSNLLWTLWNRKSYAAAAHAAAATPGRLNNPHFHSPPRNSPFDWTITPHPAVETTRGANGLQLLFSGRDNIVYDNVKQMTIISPGSYRLIIDAEAEALTTNEGPFLRVYDVDVPGRLDVRSEKFHGSRRRERTTLQFTAPPAARAIAVQLQRDRSQKFDNKIGGRLNVYELSLIPVGRSAP